jgi:hypothetical protein
MRKISNTYHLSGLNHDFKTFFNYEKGFAAFGSNCLKSASITIQVVPGA